MMIDRNVNLVRFVEDSLEQIRLSRPVCERACPHCGLPVRYPVIARQNDIQDFQMLMHCTFEAMKKYNITGNILADIKAQIAIEAAKKAASNSKNG